MVLDSSWQYVVHNNADDYQLIQITIQYIFDIVYNFVNNTNNEVVTIFINDKSKTNSIDWANIEQKAITTFGSQLYSNPTNLIDKTYNDVAVNNNSKIILMSNAQLSSLWWLSRFKDNLDFDLGGKYTSCTSGIYTDNSFLFQETPLAFKFNHFLNSENVTIWNALSASGTTSISNSNIAKVNDASCFIEHLMSYANNPSIQCNPYPTYLVIDHVEYGTILECYSSPVCRDFVLQNHFNDFC